MKNSTLTLLMLLVAACLQAQTNRSINAFAKIGLAEKPCTITGTLQGYDPMVDSFKFCQVIYNHLYKSEQQTHVGQIGKTGQYALTFPLNRPQELMFQFGDELVLFYGVPGTALDVTINFTEIKERSKLPYEQRLKLPTPISFAGPLAQLNRDFTAFRPVTNGILSYKEHNKMIDSLDQLAYKAYRLGKMQRMLDSLAAYNNRNNTSTEFRQLSTQYIRYYAAEDLLRYRWLHGMSKQPPAPIKLSEEYLSLLQEFPVNNEEAVITDAYSAYLGEFTSLRRSSGINVFPKQTDTLGFLKSLPDDQQDHANAVRKAIAVPETQRTPEQWKVIEAFNNAHQKAFMEYFNTRAIFPITDSILLPLPSGKGKDIIGAKLILHNLHTYRTPFQAAELQQLTRLMTDKDLIAQLKSDNDQLRDALAGKTPKSTNLRTPLQVSSDRFFDELVKPYKGKVVYIDFWAPWCGPCMGEMPNSKILQQELKGKDVVFLYIGISCTKPSWENTIKAKDITGEHYYANDDEGKLLSVKFNISGIPHYVLVDKQGKVADGRTHRPGDKNKLIKKIDALLKK